MDTRLKNKSSSNNNNRAYISEKKETDIAQENISESPSSLGFNFDSLVTSTSSPKKSRRAIQKRVVQIPIKEVEGFRLKGESNNTPPSDSWAWRKYGQKPIKGSPYPRGYYRCSSSKGCPARKQVERSRVDPTMLVVTYSSDHNHPWPPSRSNHHHHKSHVKRKPEHEVVTGRQDPEPEPEAEEKFADLGDESMITTADEFGWFGEMEAAATTSSAVLESPLFTGDDADAASMFLPMREEDESLFADLGELPECSMVFRRGLLEREEQRQRCTASWWGTPS